MRLPRSGVNSRCTESIAQIKLNTMSSHTGEDLCYMYADDQEKVVVNLDVIRVSWLVGTRCRKHDATDRDMKMEHTKILECSGYVYDARF